MEMEVGDGLTTWDHFYPCMRAGESEVIPYSELETVMSAPGLWRGARVVWWVRHDPMKL